MPGYPVDRRFWDRVLKMIARHTNGRPDPEELLSTAFLRLEQYESRKPVGDPIGFLVRTARNIAIDEYRHEQISSRHRKEMQHCQLEPDDVPLQDEVLAARARLARVKDGLAQLPPRTQEIFLMYRLHDMKCREIAIRVGLSESSVEKHIAKAMYFLTKWSEGW